MPKTTGELSTSFMCALGTRYSILAGGGALTFQMQRIGQPANVRRLVQVSVSLTGCSPTPNSVNVRLALLDENSSPLVRLTPNSDFEPLRSMTWRGRTTFFKSDVFEHRDREPSALYLGFHDQTWTYPLLLDEESLGDDDPDSGEEVDDGASKDGKTDKCCPEKFITPEGDLPTVVRKITIAGQPVRYSLSCKAWVVEAKFKDTSPCKCTCCEYRQRLKGRMKVYHAAPGVGEVEEDISAVMDYILPDPGSTKPNPVKQLKEDSFVEDAAGDPNNPGKPTKYGHRDTIAGNPEKPDITQDYPTACSYWGMDQPGGMSDGATIATFAAGDRVDIDLTFQGKIIDVRNSGADVPGFVREWKWVYQKKLG